MSEKRRSPWFREGGEPRRGWCRGIWCDSSWECAFLLWHLDHGIEIVRNTEEFPYPFRNGVKYYRPDFLVDGKYVELKGVMDFRSKRKLDFFPYPIRVVGKREIGPYLEYAKLKYGSDFAETMLAPARNTGNTTENQ